MTILRTGARMTVTGTPGTGTITLNAAVPPFLTFAQAGVPDGATVRYTILDGVTGFEQTSGVYTASGTTLTRAATPVVSNNSGAKINASSASQIYIDPADIDILSFGEAQTFTATEQTQARANIYAAPFDALAYNGMQVNGSMEVSQENGTTAVAAGGYGVDGFKTTVIHGSFVAAVQQVVPPGSPSFGLAFPKCLQVKMTTGGAIGNGGLVFVDHKIEGYRASRLGFSNAAAQSVTIGFWVYATIAGTMCVTLINGAGDRFYISNVVVNNATTWEYKTITIPGDQAGTWLTTNGIGLYVRFCLAAGSDFYGTANTWSGGNNASSSITNFFATSNNLVCITGVVVLPGIELPSSTSAPLIMRPFDTELLLCQRYYRKSFPQGTAVAQNAGVSGAITVKNPIALGDPSEWIAFNPTMRATPAITTYNPSAANANWRDITASSDVTVSVNAGATLGDSGVLLATSGTVTTLGDILAIHYTADARL